MTTANLSFVGQIVHRALGVSRLGPLHAVPPPSDSSTDKTCEQKPNCYTTRPPFTIPPKNKSITRRTQNSFAHAHMSFLTALSHMEHIPLKQKSGPDLSPTCSRAARKRPFPRTSRLGQHHSGPCSRLRRLTIPAPAGSCIALPRLARPTCSQVGLWAVDRLSLLHFRTPQAALQRTGCSCSAPVASSIVERGLGDRSKRGLWRSMAAFGVAAVEESDLSGLTAVRVPAGFPRYHFLPEEERGRFRVAKTTPPALRRGCAGRRWIRGCAHLSSGVLHPSRQNLGHCMTEFGGLTSTPVERLPGNGARPRQVTSAS